MIEALPSAGEAAALVATVIVTGVVRGFTGGIGSNAVMAPALALLVGPQRAVPMMLMINVVTSMQLIPEAARRAAWHEALPMGLAGIAMAPLGIYLLYVMDEAVMRRAVAVAAMALTVVLIVGWRYTGPRSLPLATGIGGLSGLLNGSVGVGGPPVVFYLMSGPHDASVVRASFTIFISMVQTVSVVIFLFVGAFSPDQLVRCAIMVPPFALGIWAGTHLFRRSSEALFRRVALGLMLAVSVAALVA